MVTERRERRVELRDHAIDFLERLVLEFFEVLHMSTVVLVPAPRASGALDLPSVDLARDREPTTSQCTFAANRLAGRARGPARPGNPRACTLVATTRGVRAIERSAGRSRPYR